MPGSSSPSRSSRRRGGLEGLSAFIQQEVLKLILLIVLAIVAFFVTQAIAANNRATTLRDAAEWYHRGQRALDDGHAEAAVDAFRHATVLKRGDRQYALALVRSLVTTGQIEAARSTLLALRETTPEDPEINLQLARVDASRHDIASAVRYYHNALYAPWPADQADARRSVRLELIRLLLSSGDSNRAESELVALASDLPDTARLHLDVGDLFTAAGNERRALDQYQQALRLTPQDGAALAAAGRAAFAVGDYALALRYLQAAPVLDPELTRIRAVVEVVSSSDPLAPRIGASARRSRLMEAFAHLEQRLTNCADRSGPNAPMAGLLEETTHFSAELRRARALESDTIENGLDLIDRAVRAVTRACPPEDIEDRALMLIAEQHGVTPR